MSSWPHVGVGGVLQKLQRADPDILPPSYTFGMAYLSDRMRKRGLFIIINSLVCTVSRTFPSTQYTLY